MRPRRTALTLLLLVAAAGEAPPAEPDGLWTGALQGPVPATLAGATVLATAPAAERFLAEHHALAIDASPAPVRPPAMAPGMPWLPPAHQDIPGSVWLPEAGRDVLRPARARAYLALVSRLTGNDPGRFVLVYCHPHCWASWNAAKFLVQAGYAHVAWFPPGIEGWAQAELPLQRTAPTPY